MADAFPHLRSEVPGPRSRALAARLARVECPEVTCLAEPPIFWESAQGANVIDVDGNRYVDLVAGFGVAALGHAHPAVCQAAARQAALLPHAMGDVYPAAVKVELLEALAQRLPGDLGYAILSSSGSDAVESAIKTALRVTGRPGIVAFEGAYHGLSLGALDATHRPHFRAPFEARLPRKTCFVPYGDPDAVRAALRDGSIGAILVEPIQGRGGIRIPPAGFLRELRALADSAGARDLGARALARLEKELRPLSGVVDVRGRGLLLGIELSSGARAAEVVRDALRAGWILLAEGSEARVLALTPPLSIAEAVLDGAIDWLVERLSA